MHAKKDEAGRLRKRLAKEERRVARRRAAAAAANARPPRPLGLSPRSCAATPPEAHVHIHTSGPRRPMFTFTPPDREGPPRPRRQPPPHQYMYAST